MNQPKQNRSAIANKIKKWLEVVRELRAKNFQFAISITRLTSIKSLCQDELAARHFALYLARIVDRQVREISLPDNLAADEWETHKEVITNAVARMGKCLELVSSEDREYLRKLLRQIDSLQGNDIRHVYMGTAVHWVKSGYLLKIDYAIRCFSDRDVPYYAYKLAREYTEDYQPSYGSGLIPSSAPKLLEIAEF